MRPSVWKVRLVSELEKTWVRLLLTQVMNQGGSKYLQFSFAQQVILPGMQLTFDTTSGNNGVVTVDSPGSRT